MKKVSAIVALALCLCMLAAQVVVAESLVGEWGGTIRLIQDEKGFNTYGKVTFNANGTFAVKVMGGTATGSYSYDGNSITFSNVKTNMGLTVGTTKLALSLDGDDFEISGSLLGASGQFLGHRK